MSLNPTLNHTALDIASWYYSTAPEFAAAYARRDWSAIERLDMMEADLIERDRVSCQFAPEPDMTEEDDAREWCAAFDNDLAA